MQALLRLFLKARMTRSATRLERLTAPRSLLSLRFDKDGLALPGKRLRGFAALTRELLELDQQQGEIRQPLALPATPETHGRWVSPRYGLFLPP